MTQRYTYFNTQQCQYLDKFIISKKEHTPGLFRCRSKVLSLVTLCKILLGLRDGPKTYTELNFFSRIPYKKGYLEYVRTLTDYHFIRKSKEKPTIYALTDKGRVLLEMFE